MGAGRRVRLICAAATLATGKCWCRSRAHRSALYTQCRTDRVTGRSSWTFGRGVAGLLFLAPMHLLCPHVHIHVPSGEHERMG
jgi:hypothetical protein